MQLSDVAPHRIIHICHIVDVLTSDSLTLCLRGPECCTFCRFHSLSLLLLLWPSFAEPPFEVTDHISCLRVKQTTTQRRKITTKTCEIDLFILCRRVFFACLGPEVKVALMHRLTWAEAQGPPEFRGLPCSG